MWILEDLGGLGRGNSSLEERNGGVNKNWVRNNQENSGDHHCAGSAFWLNKREKLKAGSIRKSIKGS